MHLLHSVLTLTVKEYNTFLKCKSLSTHTQLYTVCIKMCLLFQYTHVAGISQWLQFDTLLDCKPNPIAYLHSV